MDEIGKNDILELELEDGSLVFGYVYEYSKDRVSVKVDPDSLEIAKKIKEMDKLFVMARTRYGIKNMISHVIYELSNVNRMVIENASTVTVEQKRENVRAVDSFKFKVYLNNIEYIVECLDISAGGIAFSFDGDIFRRGQILKVVFDEDLFSKKISCDAEVIKAHNGFCAVKFLNLNIYDESKITKKVFKILSGK